MAWYDNPAYQGGSKWKKWRAAGGVLTSEKQTAAVPSTTSTAAPKREPTAFEKLAARKGVDLPAEQARATAQLKAGEKVQGRTANGDSRPATAQEQTMLSSATGEYTAATPAETFYMSTLGQAISGFKAGAKFSQDLAGRDLKAMTPAFTIGKVLGSVAVLGGVGALVGKIASMMGASSPLTTTYAEVLKGFADTGTGVIGNTATKAIIGSAAGKAAISTPWKVAGALGLAIVIGKEILELTLGGKVFGQFIGQEEASQTANIAARDALIAGDLAGYDRAAAARDEVLGSKSFWDSLGAYIPYKNVLQGLDDYRKAAIEASAVYDNLAEDKKNQEETGATDAEFYAKIAADRLAAKEAERAADEIYYANIEAQAAAAKEAARADDAAYYAGLAADKIAAAKATREAAAAYWEKILADREAAEAEKRVADEEYWTAYYKTLAQFKSNSAPSKLNFGLL